MDSTGKPAVGGRGILGTQGRSMLPHGRPAPPRPPQGPFARVSPSHVSSSLLIRRPEARPAAVAARIPFGLPNLRRNVCQHFYMTGPRGAIPIHAPHMLKGLLRHESNVARCQVRGGIHLEQSYVTDICLSSRFNQCVFYEDDLTGR